MRTGGKIIFLIHHRDTEGTEKKIIFAHGEMAMGKKILAAKGCCRVIHWQVSPF
ncbi:MAG: hypothetical protein J7K15_12555 [Deltaproteobacteria bacterium]|nr:hypothetical protein [Deltaproteobacteria bacterium]